MAAIRKMFIDGSWVESSSGGAFDVVNPATERKICSVAEGTLHDARAAIDAARSAFDRGVWAGLAPAERARAIWKLADLVEEHADGLARLESTNVGKTIKYARESDLPFIMDNLRFFAGASRVLEGKSAAEYSGLGTSIIRREPLGVVAGIIPWNYPLYIAVWKVGPALAAGDTVVIKPASLTPLSMLAFAGLVEKAGIPKGVLNVVTGPGDVVGTELARSGKVDMVALTGDTSTGRAVMRAASRTVKRVHLELGGKAPLLALKDADSETVAQGAVVGGFWNTGQDCTAVTRVIVHEKIHDQVLKKMVEKSRQFRVGNPLDPTTDMGPLVSARQREKVESYISRGIEEGAKLASGGRRPPRLRRGFFLEPTVLSGAAQNMVVARDEIFGPVILVYEYSALEDAVTIANDVDFGLASSVYGRDITACMKVANRLNFGTVWINEHGALVSEMPHGGFKLSGFGKDLSMYSFEEYTRLKHVYVDLTGESRKPWHYTVFGSR